MQVAALSWGSMGRISNPQFHINAAAGGTAPSSPPLDISRLSAAGPPPSWHGGCQQPCAALQTVGSYHSGGPEYAACMGRNYEAISKVGLPNHQGACLQLPSNLQFIRGVGGSGLHRRRWLPHCVPQVWIPLWVLGPGSYPGS